MPHKFSGSEAKNKVRMMVLETDENHPESQKDAGSFGDVLDKVFKRAGDNHDPPLGIETAIHFVVEPKGGHVPSVEDFDNCHAVLLTGSMFDAHGNDEWILKLIDLLRDLWLHRPDMRFSGICFGHQILCRMLGSKVDQTEGSRWELAHTQVSLNSIGQQLFRTKNDKLNLHQMHQDHVVNAPPTGTKFLSDDAKVHVWGSTETTEVQGVYIKDRLFSSQGHLEFDEDMVKRQIEMREESGSIQNKETADAGKEIAHLEHDGEVVAGAILRLFHGDDSDIP